MRGQVCEAYTVFEGVTCMCESVASMDVRSPLHSGHFNITLSMSDCVKMQIRGHM